MKILVAEKKTWKLNEFEFSISRPHHFGVVIHGVSFDSANESSDDYLHQILLTPNNRDAFFDLIQAEGLVVCKNVQTDAASYRKVRGKSSGGKLSQAEYYHHDGCSCPTKPRLVEIRMPQQAVQRNVATAIAPFPDVMRAMFLSLPEKLRRGCLGDEAEALRQELVGRAAKKNLPDLWEVEAPAETPSDKFRRETQSHGNFPTAGEPRMVDECLSVLPEAEHWDRLQGQLTRLVRKEMDAESCRAYFRDVDKLAGAYDLPWEMGESRLMLNHANRLETTMQHRRAYQTERRSDEQNGSLVKRWTAEEA